MLGVAAVVVVVVVVVSVILVTVNLFIRGGINDTLKGTDIVKKSIENETKNVFVIEKQCEKKRNE